MKLLLTYGVDASEITPSSVASNDTVSSHAYCIEKLRKFFDSCLKGIENRTKQSFKKRTKKVG